MKIRFNLRLCTMALAITSGTVSAQQSYSPGQQGPDISSSQSMQAVSGSLAERLRLRSEEALQLQLNAQQDAQLAQIHERQRAEIAAVNQNSALTQEQRREQVIAIIRNYDGQVTSLLTQGQLRLLQQIQARDRDRLRTLQTDNLAERLQTRSQLALSLNLTAEQVREIERIRQQQRTQVESMNQNTALNQEQRREQIAAAVNTCNEQIRALLTGEQVQKMEQIVATEGSRGRTTQPEEVAELLRRREQLARELGLSADQEAQLARIREQQRAELANLNQNRQLTQEQRREQIDAILRKYGEQVRAMLKDDQLQKLDQLRDLDRDRDRTRERKRVDRPATQ